MRIAILILLALALAGCRGEPVPPDYQNMPTMTASVDDQEAAPAPPPETGTSGTATPEPDSSAEGTSAPYEPASPPTTTPP